MLRPSYLGLAEISYEKYFGTTKQKSIIGRKDIGPVCVFHSVARLLLQAWLVLLLENMFLGEKLPDIIFNLLAAQCAFIFGISFNSMKLDRSAG